MANNKKPYPHPHFKLAVNNAIITADFNANKNSNMSKKYIYHDKDWPHFTWDLAKLAPQLAKIHRKQGLLFGKMSSLGFDLQTEATLESLTTEILTTNAIENNLLDAKSVRSSLAKRLGINLPDQVKTSRAVDGVVEVMLDATRQAKEKLTKKRLFAWHAALFPTGYSGMYQIAVGKWRTDTDGPMQVISGPIGRPKVHLQAPPADQLESLMLEFLTWFNQAPTDTANATDANTDANDANDDWVIRSAVAHFWFITIHPFADGNGRIARAIAELALTRADGSERRFYSMSAQIEKDKNEYYKKLEYYQSWRTSKLDGGGLDITGWLLWYLKKLEQAIDSAEILLGTVIQKDRLWRKLNQHNLNLRQKKVIDRLIDGFLGKLTSSKYAKLAKCSQDSALRDIRFLVKIKVLRLGNGGGRNTHYVLND